MVTLGKQQQPARGLEIERLSLRGERADHHSAADTERLLGRPQRILAFARARHDQTRQIEPELRQPWRIRRAFLGKRAFLASPDDSSPPGPVGGDRQGQTQRRGLRARGGGTEFMQRGRGHQIEKRAEIMRVFSAAAAENL